MRSFRPLRHKRVSFSRKVEMQPAHLKRAKPDGCCGEHATSAHKGHASRVRLHEIICVKKIFVIAVRMKHYVLPDAIRENMIIYTVAAKIFIRVIGADYMHFCATALILAKETGRPVKIACACHNDFTVSIVNACF